VIILVFLSLVPGNLEVRTGVPGELEHFAAFFITAGLFVLSYSQRHFLILGTLVAHAGLLETLQSLSPGRTANLLDACAGAAGAVLGVAAASTIVFRYTRCETDIR
jgi:VanZ family protein